MDIFTREPVLKCYKIHPPGNIPELCDIDSCPNKYLHKAVDCHVRYTHSFHKLDPKRFSISTLKKLIPAYIKILDPIEGIDPSSERIISDTYYVLT